LVAVRGVALEAWIEWRWKAAERAIMGEAEDLTALAEEEAARRRILDMMDYEYEKNKSIVRRRRRR
jgi:hypothetical protein